MIKIKFKNWSKFQKRKDYKKQWWLALANEFPTDPKFHLFKNEEKLCFIYLLCETSRQNKSGVVDVSPHYHSRLWDINAKTIEQVIEKIESLQIAYRIRTESVQIPFATEQNRTEQYINNISGNATASPVASINFQLERLYQAYPRKLGKAEGLSRLKNVIRTEQDFRDFEQAVANYCAYIKREKIEPRFIKQFSSFVGSQKIQPWRDYLDVDVGKTLQDRQASKTITLEEIKNGKF